MLKSFFDMGIAIFLLVKNPLRPVEELYMSASSHELALSMHY